MNTPKIVVVLFALMICLTGCAKDKELERVNQQQAATIQALNQEIARLNQELDEMSSRRGLTRTQSDYQRKLKSTK